MDVAELTGCRMRRVWYCRLDIDKSGTVKSNNHCLPFTCRQSHYFSFLWFVFWIFTSYVPLRESIPKDAPLRGCSLEHIIVLRPEILLKRSSACLYTCAQEVLRMFSISNGVAGLPIPKLMICLLSFFGKCSYLWFSFEFFSKLGRMMMIN